MRTFNKVLFLFCAATVFCTVSCKKKTSNEDESLRELLEKQNASRAVNNEKLEIDVPNVSTTSYDFSVRKLAEGAFHTDAHKKFLSDPMQFAPLPDQGIKDGTTAVVGSKVCMLYPKTAFSFTAANTATIVDEQKMGGIQVPLSSIVKITGDKLLNGQTDLNDYVQQMFNFQDNWNWFYPVEWQGKTGYVYGADLFGLGHSIESNRISAELYRTNGSYTAFYPILGYYPMSNTVVKTLEKDKLVIQKTEPSDNPYPDDMIKLYKNIAKNVPVFVTTDLAAHSQHLIFDRMLQYTEEVFFEPHLASITDKFIEALSKETNAPEEVRTKAIEYFQVAQALLAMAPTRVKSDDYDEPIKYQEKDTTHLLDSYSKNVREDVNSVMTTDGSQTAIFKTEEDFSQYKPRGHYTKNGILQAYFRAEMWYGRIHFLIAQESTNNGNNEEDNSQEMVKVALLVANVVQKNKDLYDEWASLFNPITDLIGLSDDLSFDDVLPLWKSQKVTDFSTWASDPTNVTSFMALCHEKLRPPAISGNSVFDGPSDGPNHNPPMGWRFLGQRFTYDSYIHQQVSPPRLKSRDVVRGLDVMKVFGSQTADGLLAASDYPTMEGLKERLDTLEKQYSSYKSDFWNKTYYNQVLYQIKSQATFEQGAGFYFTESPAWNIKSQLAAHGTWAELRHDTILYVKQVYAERAGDGDFDPTFRTLPLPEPINYIEPNVPFWEGSLASIEGLLTIYSKYNLLDQDSEDALKKIHELYVKALDIAKKEAEDKPISSDENEWIRTIASSFENLVMIHVGRGNDAYIEGDFDQFKMACIADVFTNSALGICLETAVGVPYRLYVPLNDSQGGKRIAIGYGFSYYEFTHSQGDRMTDEQWKQIVYKETNKADECLPFWEKTCTIPAEDPFVSRY